MKTFRYVLIAFFAILSPAIAADPPTENQGANAMAAKIRAESKGLLRLSKFTKTNGQKATVNGIDVYTMECSVEVVANDACAMTGFQIGGGWDGSFGALKAQRGGNALDTFNPFGAAYGTNKQVARGAHMNFNLNLAFDLTERGWRTEGRLPADVPFKPEEPKAPEEVAPQPQGNQPFAKLIIGSWLERKIVTFLPAGKLTLQKFEGDTPDGEGRGWQIEGNKLTWITPSGNVVDTIVSLNRGELVVKGKDGSVRKFKRISK